MNKVAVFPASGKISSSIYTHLSKLLNPNDLLMISRYPEKIPHHLVDAGVKTRKADYDNADSLQHAFDGVSCLILISYPSIENDHRFNVCLRPWRWHSEVQEKCFRPWRKISVNRDRFIN